MTQIAEGIGVSIIDNCIVVESALFAWNDVVKTRKADSRGYIILNDTNRKANDALFNAIQNYELKAVPWTERDSFIDEFAS